MGTLLDIIFVLAYVVLGVLLICSAGVISVMFFPYIRNETLEEKEKERLEHED